MRPSALRHWRLISSRCKRTNRLLAQRETLDGLELARAPAGRARDPLRLLVNAHCLTRPGRDGHRMTASRAHFDDLPLEAVPRQFSEQFIPIVPVPAQPLEYRPLEQLIAGR